MNYEIIKNMDGQNVVVKTDDDGIVSMFTENESNSDYQAYLAWKAEQPAPKAGK